MRREIQMTRLSIEPSLRKYGKGYRFLLFKRNLSNKHGKILDNATKRGLYAAKVSSKKGSQ